MGKQAPMHLQLWILSLFDIAPRCEISYNPKYSSEAKEPKEVVRTMGN